MADSAPTSASSLSPPSVLPESGLEHWMLDPTIDFLNHGCFGARLRVIFDAQMTQRKLFETRPIFNLDRHRDTAIDMAKMAVGPFLGMKRSDFGFVTNATAGFNAVLRSLDLKPGDEVLTTDHVYQAVRQTMRYLTERAGATSIEAAIPLPCPNSAAVVDAIESKLTGRTRLVVIDHVTSPTALRFPVETIIERCTARGIDVFVDGAHAPGMLDLDVASVGAAYYTGNLHKWIGAPPGAAFLWVHPDRQESIHPPVISHFLGEGMAAEFQWQGTRDISPWLVAAAAIEAMEAIGGSDGWAAVRAHNHALVRWAESHLCAAWNVAPNSPTDGSMLGSIASITVPERLRQRFADPDALHDLLYDEHHFEVPCFEWNGHWLLRVSAQVYNRPEQYERLGRVVAELMA